MTALPTGAGFPAAANGGRGSTLLQKIDRRLGIPLVWILGLLRRKRPLPSTIKTIAILETAAIGDTILLTGPIADIRAAYPDATIVLFVGDSNAAMAPMIADVDEIVVLPVPKPLPMLQVLRDRPFDLLLDFGPWPRMNALLSRLSRARFIAGFRTGGQFRHFAYDHCADHLGTRHELENLRSLLRACGIPAARPPRLTIDPEVVSRVARSVRSPYVVLHPWPGGVKSHLKQWPEARWIEVIRDVTARGFTVYIVGGKGDRDRTRAMIRAADIGADKAFSRAGDLCLVETAALLSGAAAAICVNSGIMHLGSALDVPMVGIHGPTAPHRWGPTGRNAVVVAPDCPGCGYLNLGFEYPTDPPPCMDAVSVDRVLAAFESLGLPEPARDATGVAVQP